MPRAKVYAVITAAGLITCSVFLLEKTVWWQHFWHASGPGRQELLDLYEVLTPGEPESQIMEVWGMLSPKYLTIAASPQKDRYFIRAPRSFFYRDWLLLVNIKDGKILDVEVRTRDSLDMHPEEAPPDKRKPWRPPAILSRPALV